MKDSRVCRLARQSLAKRLPKDEKIIALIESGTGIPFIEPLINGIHFIVLTDHSIIRYRPEGFGPPKIERLSYHDIKFCYSRKNLLSMAIRAGVVLGGLALARYYALFGGLGIIYFSLVPGIGYYQIEHPSIPADDSQRWRVVPTIWEHKRARTFIELARQQDSIG